MKSLYLTLFFKFITFNAIKLDIYITQSQEIRSYPWVLGIDSPG